MKINAFKQVAMATVLLGLNSFVLAQDQSRQDNFVSQNSNSSQKNNAVQEKGSKSGMTPSPYLGDKMPPYNNPNRFMMETSFIYWQADADGFDFAMTQDFAQAGGNTGDSLLSQNTKFQDRRLDFKWDPGFKVGMGVIFGQSDEWDLFLNWTWLRSKANGSYKTDGETSVIIPEGDDPDILRYRPTTGFATSSYSSPLIFGPLAGTSAHWKLQYNTLDLELGRNFFLAKNFTIRPIIGVRGAWLHQHINVNYEFANISTVIDKKNYMISGLPYPIQTLIGNTSATTSISNIGRFSGQNNYSGAGLRAGFDMNWNFMDQFCAYSTVSGSVLYGFYDIDQKFNTEYTAVSSEEINNGIFQSEATLHDGYHRTRTNLQILLGLMWHRGFNNDKQHLSIGVSYEVNEWFQQNELRNFEVGNPGRFFSTEGAQSTSFYSISNSRIGGDLGLHGVNFDVKFDF